MVSLSICCKNSNMSKMLRPVSSHTQRNTIIFLLSRKTELHWLTVKLRIEFKMLILTFKAYHEIGPKNLTDSLIKYTRSRTLPSTNKGLLVVPKYVILSPMESALFQSLPPHSGTIYTRPNKNYSMLEFFLRIELRPFYSAVPSRLFFMFL